MIYNCPISTCKSSTKNGYVSKDGFYFRRDDSRKIQRFVCKTCGKKFSRATFSPEKNQKKRRINDKIFCLLSSLTSMRRTAFILNINYKTVQRKMEYLSLKSQRMQKRYLKSLERKQVLAMQFDDLITFEHTKMKPLSVSVAVDKKTRMILGAKVSRIPASGPLAEKSRSKYGYRRSKHREGLNILFKSISKSVAESALIESDEHKFYPKVVRRYFPISDYRTYKSIRSSHGGQGELKKTKFDPIRTINHTHAMLRGNINRLVRKTWCTTKKADMLQKHIDIYIAFHNFHYLRLMASPL
ncbi:hypothetical protein [Bacteriovorax sp. Seq25_V]|uniref:hypothetical protein n=1 Tax=Bacteriovorax sp. Seq25_V TaxID=1201288 RepID=UPI000389F0EA|nr:hypothetical protein [Bacteriovorax sp. Seq25_V]EQC44295.1 hypothetical protein M900_A0412 [Bacteriovorax sp. Seq25_V]